MNTSHPGIPFSGCGAAILAAWIGLPPVAILAAGPRVSGEVSLELDGGAGAGGGMALSLDLKDGRWGEEVWGRAAGHNFGQHTGQVAARQGTSGEESLTIALAIAPDTVGPGGKAEYKVILKRREDVFEGAFSGVFCDEPVSGAVHGAVSEPLIRSVAGFKPVEREEHPRMVFRKSDMPELKRRMETPEGKAMMAMLTARAPLRMPSQVTDRHATWMAANWGAVYQLTGDREAAAEARRIVMEEMVAKRLPSDRDDVHQAPRLLGAALTYDLCHDAWEAEFRRNLAELIMMTAEDLYRGYLRSVPELTIRVDPVPWRCRNAVRVSCAGAAALAVMGDADASGKPMRDAARMARAAERDLVEWLRDGVTGTGFALDGSLQKSICLANGVLAFMNANRIAMGRDMAGVNPMLVAGYALTGRAADDGSPRLGISSISVQASGRWPMGFAAVPDTLRGAMRWLFDRDVGLAGKKHFDCAYPYQAAYAIVNYPFDVEARDPGQGIPLFVADMRHGSVVFRNRWKDSRDIIAVLEFNSMSLPGVDLRTGPQAGCIRISGLGGEWLNGVVGVRPINSVFGGEMLYAESVGEGKAVVGARLDPAYRIVAQAPVRRVAKSTEWGVAPEMRFVPPMRPATNDVGIRCTRHVGIDYTGAAGVPGLFVVADVLRGAASRPWQFPAPSGGAGTNLTWQFATSASPQNARPGGGMADGLRLAVGTLQEGKAPELRTGAFADGKVSAAIGGQTITFTGDRIVFGK